VAPPDETAAVLAVALGDVEPTRLARQPAEPGRRPLLAPPDDLAVALADPVQPRRHAPFRRPRLAVLILVLRWQHDTVGDGRPDGGGAQPPGTAGEVAPDLPVALAAV
jgi:hypothetical protein